MGRRSKVKLSQVLLGQAERVNPSKRLSAMLKQAGNPKTNRSPSDDRTRRGCHATVGRWPREAGQGSPNREYDPTLRPVRVGRANVW